MEKRFTEAQIAFALRTASSGTPIAEITRQMGISEPTFYRWKKLYAGKDINEVWRFMPAPRLFESADDSFQEVLL